MGFGVVLYFYRMTEQSKDHSQDSLSWRPHLVVCACLEEASRTSQYERERKREKKKSLAGAAN